MADDWCRFVEIFGRRNIVIHAGGTVTGQYLSLLRSAGCSEDDLPLLGEELELDDSMLRARATTACIWGTAFGGTWLQLRKNASLTAELWIKERTEHLLELEHFSAVKTICRTVLSRSRARRDTELEM